jgi:hypothetical protein
VLIHRNEGTPWQQLQEQVTGIAPATRWEGQAGDFAQVVADFEDLAAIAELPDVFYVLRPPRAVPCRTGSEGLGPMKVGDFQSLGYRGHGVRTAILDLGFAGYDMLLGNELPAELRVRSFFRSPDGEGDITGDGVNHGTGCAEIVHEIAPAADLYLVNAESPVDLLAAVEWLIDEQVQIISHSIGWYFGSLDGIGPINDVAERATYEGILWANAAGNEADRHSWTSAVDDDGDDLIEFAPRDERVEFRQLRSGESLEIALLWDEWPLATNLDLVLECVDANNMVLASTEQDFEGYPYAVRFLVWTSPDGRPVAIRVRRKRGTLQGQTIHLFRTGHGVGFEDHLRPDRSLLTPADSRSVLAVGAVGWATDSLAEYSSRGALEGEPVKPELCGPTGVSTRVYGPEAFHGTSSATPHVAGAAALLASAGLRGGYYDILWSRDDLYELLAEYARAAPHIHPLGWGIVQMPVRPVQRQVAGPLLLGNPAAGIVRWAGACETVEIFDAAGRIVAHCQAPPWDGRNDHGYPVSPGVYWIRCPGGSGASRVAWLGR